MINQSNGLGNSVSIHLLKNEMFFVFPKENMGAPTAYFKPKTAQSARFYNILIVIICFFCHQRPGAEGMISQCKQKGVYLFSMAV